MSTNATATFRVTGWDEKPYDEIEGGPKLTRATVTKVFSGDIEGDATVEYLMIHRGDGSADFVGVERIVGRVGDRSGSFVFKHEGSFVDGVAKTTCTVVPGSGAGDLEGLRGQGRFESGHAEEYSFAFEYTFE
ncbi:MAG: DUF3224 domain-containing protein [Gemmatimonadetes bacterium]|nr:DUF3224 domain-containing protein [Gemmatimonadota bacterium]